MYQHWGPNSPKKKKGESYILIKAFWVPFDIHRCHIQVRRKTKWLKVRLWAKKAFVWQTTTRAILTCGEREGGWTVVARLSSLFVGVGWQGTLLELWDWLGSPATVRVMGLVTGRFPPGPTCTESDNNDTLNERIRNITIQGCVWCLKKTVDVICNTPLYAWTWLSSVTAEMYSSTCINGLLFLTDSIFTLLNL